MPGGAGDGAEIFDPRPPGAKWPPGSTCGRDARIGKIRSRQKGHPARPTVILSQSPPANWLLLPMAAITSLTRRETPSASRGQFGALPNPAITRCSDGTTLTFQPTNPLPTTPSSPPPFSTPHVAP